MFVNIYVDDLLYTGNNLEMLQEFKESMKGKFEMTDLGKMRYFLGTEVVQTPAGWNPHISNEICYCDIACKLKLEERAPIEETIFKQVVGSLMYITTTRPDLQFEVS